MKFFKTAALSTCLLASASADAMDGIGNTYAGAKLGLLDIDGFNDMGLSVGALAGAEFTDLNIDVDNVTLGAEIEATLSVTDAESTFGATKVEGSAFSLGAYGVGKYAIDDQLYLKGKAGLNLAFLSVEAPTFGGTINRDDTEIELVVGGGFGMHVTEEISVEAEITLWGGDAIFFSAGANMAFDALD